VALGVKAAEKKSFKGEMKKAGTFYYGTQGGKKRAAAKAATRPSRLREPVRRVFVTRP